MIAEHTLPLAPFPLSELGMLPVLQGACCASATGKQLILEDEYAEIANGDRRNICNDRLPATGYRLPTTSYQLPATSHQLVRVK